MTLHDREIDAIAHWRLIFNGKRQSERSLCQRLRKRSQRSIDRDNFFDSLADEVEKLRRIGLRLYML